MRSSMFGTVLLTWADEDVGRGRGRLPYKAKIRLKQQTGKPYQAVDEDRHSPGACQMLIGGLNQARTGEASHPSERRQGALAIFRPEILQRLHEDVPGSG